MITYKNATIRTKCIIGEKGCSSDAIYEISPDGCAISFYSKQNEE